MVEPWYKEGVRFQCTQCGKCCTGEPGYVWIEEEDVTRMAAHLQISERDFKRKYTRFAYGKLALLENKSDYSCVFLKEKQCTLYESRPKQCRTFPFWPQNLRSQKSWEEVKGRCEGVDHPDAPLIIPNDL